MKIKGQMKIEIIKRDYGYPDLPIIYISLPDQGWLPADRFLSEGETYDVIITNKGEQE